VNRTALSVSIGSDYRIVTDGKNSELEFTKWNPTSKYV